MSDETDLAAWLLEQIAEDERIAREATPGPWMALDSGVVSYDDPGDESGQGVWPVDVTQSNRDRQDRAHIVTWNPRRAIAECEAKRRIIERWRAADESATNAPDYSGGLAHGLEEAIYLLAQPYADRPGWREEWALDDEGRPAMEDGG